MKKIIISILLIVFTNISFGQNPIIINSDQRWQSYQDADPMYEYGIVITDNSTLIISCSTNTAENLKTFNFRPGSQIVIEPGSRLIIENAILTHQYVCGCTWGGIEIQGNSNQAQNVTGSSRNQGLLILRNEAKIAYADTAIRVRGGGCLLMSNSTLYECLQGINFEAYSQNNKSYVINSHLYNTDNSNECTNQLLEWHIHINQCKGIRIEGNIFEFENVTGNSTLQGKGIFSFNSSYKVQKSMDLSSMPSNCRRNGNSNIFKNLMYGIIAGTTDTSNRLEFHQNSFKNCGVGIYLLSDKGTKIYNNSFEWDNSYEDDFNDSFTGTLNTHADIPQPDVCGIVSYHSKDLKIIQNEFKMNFNNSSPFYRYAIALNHNEYETTKSEIYNNNFTGDTTTSKYYLYGILTDVSDLTGSQTAKLYMSCNTFNKIRFGHILYAANNTNSQRLVNQEGRNYTQNKDADNSIFNLDTFLWNVNTGYYSYKTVSSPSWSYLGNINIETNGVNSNSCSVPNPCLFITSPVYAYPGDQAPVDTIKSGLIPVYRRVIYYWDDILYVDTPLVDQQQKRTAPPDDENSFSDNDIYLTIYPNPSENYFFIQFESQLTLSELEIYNSLGLLKFEKKVKSQSGQIEINNQNRIFNSGVYLLLLKFSDGTSKSCNFIVK